MKQGLTGSATNELEVLSIAYEERQRAIQRRDELSQRERDKSFIVQTKIQNDCIIKQFNKPK